MFVFVSTRRRNQVNALTAALMAGSASMTGVGSISGGTGILLSQSSTLAGAGTSLSTGTGALAAQASTLSGAGTAPSGATGSGALSSGASSVAGAGTSLSTGSGALASQASTLVGVGIIPSTTTWSTTDKKSVTLSGGNLIATGAATKAGVRAEYPQYRGKWFWETTINTIAGAGTSVGIAGPGMLMAAATVSGGTPSDRRPSDSIADAGKLGCIIYKSGNQHNNGATRSLNALTAAVVVAHAVDLDASPPLYGVKVGANNWNNNVANDPWTNAQDITAIAQLGIFPVVGFGAVSDQVTANFGATSFSNSVPSGCNAGWLSNTNAYIDPLSIWAEEVRTGATGNKTILVSTKGSAEVIIVVATEKTTSAANTTVSGATLGSFTLRHRYHVKPSTIDIVIEEWQATASGALTNETVTVALGGSTNDKLTVISYAIAQPVSGIWDANGAAVVDNSATTGTQATVAAVSTSNAHDIIVQYSCFTNNNDMDHTKAGTGNTMLQGFFNHTSGTNWCTLSIIGRYVTSTQSGITFSSATVGGTSGQWAAFTDAIKIS